MAEVLIVVAIVIVLAGVGFIALMSHMRTMHQLELDGHAKEIFVAAQNHLSMAKGQDYLGLTNDSDFGTVSNLTFTAGGEATGDESEEGKGIYYLLVDDASDLTGVAVLKQILPFGSMDEAARTQGSYIIRYQKDPGIVLDVFYSEKGDKRFAHTLKEGDYATLMADRGSNDGKKQRRDYTNAATSAKNAVIGWYGGGAEGLPTGEKLKIPGVEIENGDRLLVRVTDYNTDVNGGKNALNLMIDCGSVTIQIPLLDKDGKPAAVSTSARRTESSNTYTVVLDDVTENNLHFAQLYSQFPSDNVGSIVPGCDIKVYAVAYNNDYLTNVAESPKQETNSLFASPIKESKTAKIASIRHLLNLDYTISGLSAPIERAEQISDLVWDDGDAAVSGCFLDNIKGAATQIYPYNGGAASDPSAAGSYMPVNPPSGLNYQGLPGTNHITGITVTGGTGAAGLFGSLDSGSVTDLELIDFKVSASGDVGALAGSAANTYITGVLARSSKTGGVGDKSSGADIDYKIVSTGAAAGGLVGSMNNGTVDRSAAAVYVQGKTNVGGLVGGMNNGVVTKSYSGGHTQNAKYQEATAVSEEVYTIVNVISEANAGGLIGHMDGTTVEYSYSTASSTGATVGGLVGASAGGTVKTCYAIGLVNPTGDGPASSLVGSFTSSTTFDGDNNYLEGVSSKANNTGYTSISAVSGISAGADKTSFLIPEASRKPAYPYDKTLVVNFGTKTADNEDIVGYFFPTIDQLASLSAADSKPGITDRHVGDWYLPNMEILYYTIVNDNTLYTEITLKEHTRLVTVAVYGETSKAAKAFLLEVAEDKSSVNLIDMGTLVGNDIRWTGTPAAGTNLPDYGISGTDTKKVTVTMDDITTEKKHFASIFPDLLPGENITVLAAGGNCGWPELQTLRQKTYPADMEGAGRIIALSDNSLFAKPTDLKNAAVNYSNDSFKALLASVSNAEIINIRHLQNLDTSVSNVNADSAHKTATAAKLMNDINWTSEEWNDLPAADWWLDHFIYRYNSSTYIQMGHFNGIVNSSLSSFDGNDKTIKGMVIGNTFGEGAGHAGFFRRVNKTAPTVGEVGLIIKNLHLDSPSITAQSGSAGAFIGLNNGDTKLDKVLAEGDANYEIKALSGSAGGLVGYSQRTLNITNSAASMLVTGSGAAGGLVGQQTGDTGELKISKSYVGGHTYGGVYYVNADAAEDATADVNGVDGESGERWNVISTGGAAGGLLGLLDAKATLEIEESFNAASVYSGAVASTGAAGGIIGAANGTISKLNLVYVVAPVSDVKEIKEVDDELVPEDGNAGSVIGVSTKEFEANSGAGSGVYFLANVYSTPMPTMLDTSVSNIKTIGSGTLKNIKLAYYYVKAGQDNAILPYVHSDIMEQRTDSFDGSLGEYPFAIWTKFAFDGSDILHFYGDWQPAEKGPTIHLDVEFYTVLPADETTGAARVAKHLTARDQEIAVQIPYEGAAIQLPWPEDVFNYNFGDWAFYYGEQGSKVLSDSAIDASDTSATVFSKSKNGFNVYMSVTDFKKLNQDKYKTTDENGETHLHITLVSTYVKRDNPLYKLEFYDAKFKTVDGTEALDGYESEPLTYQVLEPLPNDDPTLAKVTLDQLVEGKQPPTRNKAGFRFLGWYLKNGENYTPIYENVFNSATNSFGLVLNETEAAKVTVDHDIQLYAKYEPIPYRTINVTFVDGDGIQIPSVEPYEIRFEGDRGFKETVIPLPYTENVLYPDTEETPVVTGKSDSDTVVWSLDGENPTVKIAIAPVTTVTDANREINCKVTYTVKADYTGYVVLYELLDTSATSASTYSAGNSYIYSYDLTEDYLYGTTIVGYSPTVDVEEDARFENYLLTKQPEGFEISGARVVKQTGDNPFPSKYSGKYPTTLDMGTEDTADDLNVTYLVVIQCRRVSSWLTFDTRGGGNIAPVKLVYGKPLNDILKNADGSDVAAYVPTYTSYTFQKWVYTTKEADGSTVEHDAIGAKMPGHDLQLVAKREGAPVKFTVLIMEQNANDDGYTLGAMYTQYTKSGSTKDMKANAGSDVWVSLDHDAKKATLTWKDGTSDETTTYDIINIKPAGKNKIKPEYTYFHLRDELPYTVTVSDDGSTAVKIYLDRNYYSVWYLMGKATGGTINTKQGYFDNELGTHEVHQYTRRDGSTFWAYEDEDAGKPYGEESNKYFELDVVDVNVPVYKPEGVYTLDNSPNPSHDKMYGVSDGFYQELGTTNGYVEEPTRSLGVTYYGKEGEDNYFELTYGGRTSQRGHGSTLDTFVPYTTGDKTYDRSTNDNDNNPQKYGVVYGELVELTYSQNKWYYYSDWFRRQRYRDDRYIIASGTTGDYYFNESDGAFERTTVRYTFKWNKANNVEYSRAYSMNENLGNNYTVSGGTHYLLSQTWALNNIPYTGDRYYRTTYPADGATYKESELEPRGAAFYYRDSYGNLVETVSAGNETVPTYKIKDSNVDYTGTVYFLVIVDNPVHLDVNEFVPGNDPKYFVSTYSNTDWLWANERQVITEGNTNPFASIPSANLRLVDEENSNYIAFYYCICDRYGASIRTDWPDLNWQKSHGLGLLNLKSSTGYREFKFTSWLFPKTSRYYAVYVSTMTSIKGPYATMSEELILQRKDSNSNTYFDKPDDGSGNTPSVTMIGRYRDTPNWWRFVYHFGKGGKNPGTLNQNTATDWRTEYVNSYSDGPSKNQNPIPYEGYTCVKGPTYADESKNSWQDIHYYYEPNLHYIHFYAKLDANKAFAPNGAFVEINTKNAADQTTNDAYFFDTPLNIADAYSSYIEERVPAGYEFKGWYRDSVGDTKFEFKTTDLMPDGDLMLYAIITPVDKKVTFTLTKPTGAAGTVMWAKANENDPDDTADRVFANVPHNSTLVSRIDAFVTAHGGAAFEPVLEGYRFKGWIEQGTTTAFAPSQQIIKNYTLVPDWEKLPDPVHKTVTVKYVQQADPTAAVHDPTTADVIVDDTYKFTAQSVNGYKPETSYYYETIDNAWLEEHKVAGTENQYEVTFYYIPADNTWTYTVQYNLYLTPVNGGAAAEIPLQTGTETSSSNFEAVSFFTLPDSMNGYKVANLKLFEGSTQVDSTTDPIIFVKKAENVTLVVNVVPDDSLILQGEVVRTYNAKPQGVESEFESSLPTLPSGVAFVRTVAYTYNGSETKPTNVGAYQVGVTVTVTYNDVVYFYWESATASASRPDMVLYIDPCDVIVTSESVTNVFLNTAKNQKDKTDGKLPAGAVLANIVQNLTAGAAKDTNVEISVSGSDSTDILAKLNGSDGLLISPSADAFRRAGSKGPDDYTTNTFYCEMKNSADNANFNFYKVYGKLYIWEDLDAYNKWKNPGT